MSQRGREQATATATRLATMKTEDGQRGEAKEADQRPDSVPEDTLPIVDEVNNILLKERTLHELKVLEQQVQKEEWKTKYEQLLSKVADPDNPTHDFNIIEAAAEVDSKAALPMSGGLQSVLMKLPSSSTNWNLNASGIPIGEFDMKKIFNLKNTHRSCHVTTLNLSNCELDDLAANLCGALSYHEGVRAIDFSFNKLASGFHTELIRSVEVQI